MTAYTDWFHKHSRATAAYFKKWRLYRVILNLFSITAHYGRARPGATPVRDDDVSSRRFSIPERILTGAITFSSMFGPFCLLRRLLPTRVIRCASDDPQQHSLLFTADTKADVRNVITVIMKIHGACESGRFILLTFRWLTVCLRLIACSFKQDIFDISGFLYNLYVLCISKIFFGQISLFFIFSQLGI